MIRHFARPASLYLIALSSKLTTACSSRRALMLADDAPSHDMLTRMSRSAAAAWQSLTAASRMSLIGRFFQRQLAFLFALLDLRQAQQVLDDLIQAVRLLGDDPQETLGVFRVVHCTIQQRFDKTLDRSDRRLQLVRNVGHEVAADILQVPDNA